MKNIFFYTFCLVFLSISVFSQSLDSLSILQKKMEMELKKKEMEMKQQELEIKKQEFEIKKETRIEEKEEKKEEKLTKEKKKKTDEEIQAENQVRMSKTSIVSLQPFSLVIGGLELGLEKKSKRKNCG
jgi:uncharacterized protein YajQ (UPF0234 family)